MAVVIFIMCICTRTQCNATLLQLDDRFITCAQTRFLFKATNQHSCSSPLICPCGPIPEL